MSAVTRKNNCRHVPDLSLIDEQGNSVCALCDMQIGAEGPYYAHELAESQPMPTGLAMVVKPIAHWAVSDKRLPPHGRPGSTAVAWATTEELAEQIATLLNFAHKEP